jgi:hypothetical protein
MTLPIDLVAADKAVAGLTAGLATDSAVVCLVTAGAAAANSGAVKATVGLAVIDPAQPDREAKPTKLTRQMTFSIKFFTGKSLGVIIKIESIIASD